MKISKKVKLENILKIKAWVKKIRLARKYDLPKAKKRFNNLVMLGNLTDPELENAQIEVDEILKNIKSMNKVVRNLKREK